MYRDMRFARRFDERMISLQRQGRLGPLVAGGQEISLVGSTYALADEDTIFYQTGNTAHLWLAGSPGSTSSTGWVTKRATPLLAT